MYIIGSPHYYYIISLIAGSSQSAHYYSPISPYTHELVPPCQIWAAWTTETLRKQSGNLLWLGNWVMTWFVNYQDQSARRTVSLVIDGYKCGWVMRESNWCSKCLNDPIRQYMAIALSIFWLRVKIPYQVLSLIYFPMRTCLLMSEALTHV